MTALVEPPIACRTRIAFSIARGVMICCGRMPCRANSTAVELARQGIRPQQIITPRAIENAIRVLHAIGGSTNAVIHLIAFARRLGYDLPLEHFDRLGRDTPFLVNMQPNGPKFVMEDFHGAGGMPAV